MLELAMNHKDTLNELYRNKVIFNDKYKFWNCSNYFDDKFKISDSTYADHQFASVNRDGDIIGYIGYAIDRTADDRVHGLSVLNFIEEDEIPDYMDEHVSAKENKIIFGIDMVTAITDIFEKFNFRTLSFTVVIGNPVEKTYDQIIDKYGGRIVGIFKDYVKLIDNKYYDYKLYQISRDEYYAKKNKKSGEEYECMEYSIPEGRYTAFKSSI